MEARAELRQVRISPRKVGVVLDLIRNKPLRHGYGDPQDTPVSERGLYRSSSSQQWQTQRNNHSMDLSSAMFHLCHVGAGVTLKRIRPKDHGRAHRILKRTSTSFWL